LFCPSNKRAKLIPIDEEVKDRGYGRQQKQPIAHWLLLSRTRIIQTGSFLNPPKGLLNFNYFANKKINLSNIFEWNANGA
jgi:hypothetical protein